MLYHNSIYWLSGVVSYGPIPCGAPNYPGVYTRVTSFIYWIQNNIRPQIYIKLCNKVKVANVFFYYLFQNRTDGSTRYVAYQFPSQFRFLSLHQFLTHVPSVNLLCYYIKIFSPPRGYSLKCFSIQIYQYRLNIIDGLRKSNLFGSIIKCCTE